MNNEPDNIEPQEVPEVGTPDPGIDVQAPDLPSPVPVEDRRPEPDYISKEAFEMFKEATAARISVMANEIETLRKSKEDTADKKLENNIEEFAIEVEKQQEINDLRTTVNNLEDEVKRLSGNSLDAFRKGWPVFLARVGDNDVLTEVGSHNDELIDLSNDGIHRNNATLSDIEDAEAMIELNDWNDGSPTSRFYRIGGAARTCLVFNDSGSTVPKLGVLGIDSSYIDPTTDFDEFVRRVKVVGVEPDILIHRGKFVIAAQEIPDQTIGVCYIDGVCPAVINVTDDDFIYADVKDGDVTELETYDYHLGQVEAGGHALILWREAGTGSGKRAIVRLSSGDVGGADCYITGTHVDLGDTVPSDGTDTTDWVAYGAGGDNGLNMFITTDVYWDSITNTLSQVKRLVHVGACGRWGSVSSEVLVEVDVAEPCEQITELQTLGI